MDRVLGSPFETSLRILILLGINNTEKMTENMLCALDFIIIYALDFGISDNNLHGYGSYRFGEYGVKKVVIKQALKELVLDGLIDVKSTRNGFVYSISNLGITYIQKFECYYADDYRITACEVCDILSDKREDEIIAMINKYTLASV